MAKRNSDRRRSQADQKPQAKDRLRSGVSAVKAAWRTLPGGNAKAVCIVLFGLVVWVFLPSVRNEFVNFDDPLYITSNPHVQAGLTLETIRWAFVNMRAGFWQPLTWLSSALDCQLFGLRAGGHHLTSLLLHAASTVVLFLAFRRMTGAIWRSAFVALLFALHPLHVETVAWAADRKDVLSGLFWMLTLLMYAHYVERSKVQGPKSEVFYSFALLLFACALMSKASVLTLPFILFLLDWWPLRRFQLSDLTPELRRKDLPAGHRSVLRRLLLEKVPFLLLGFAYGILGFYGQKALGAVQTAAEFPISQRIQNAILSCVQYLAQTAWPMDLAAYYPYPATFGVLTVFGAALLLAVVTFGALWSSRNRPYIAFGWIWFVVTLVPASGLVQIGSHARADRYTYLPLIGAFVLLVWGVQDLARHWCRQLPALSAAVAIIGFLAVAVTRQQLGFWRNSETLYRRALAVTQANEFAHYNLATTLIEKGQLDEAIPHFEEAIRVMPDFPAAHKNLGAALCMKGRVDEAIPHLEYAATHAPGDPETHSNLGNAFAMKGRFEAAIPQYEQALAISPGSPEVRHNLGQTHFQLALAIARVGGMDDAILHFRKAIDLAPDHAEAHCNLGIALVGKGRFDEAIPHFQQALKLNPDYAEAHCDVGVALARKGRLEEAIPHLREALRLKPDYADAQNNLRAALNLRAAAATPPAPSTRR